MKRNDGLTERERQFVEQFMATGNATKAAVSAGYSKKTAGQIGYRLLKKVQIQKAISQRTEADPAVWTREDRQKFWTAVASGSNRYQTATLRERLKASELLGRSQADFIERREVDTGPTLEELIGAGYSLEAEESERIGKLPPDEVLEECRQLHRGQCASLREHAARCSDARWLAGEYGGTGDRWRETAKREGREGLICGKDGMRW